MAADALPDAGRLLADPIGDQLQRRLERALADARRLLGDAAEGADVAALRSTVMAALAERDASDAAPAWKRFDELHELHLGLLRLRYERRARALERVQKGIASLRDLTSPAALIAAGAGHLCSVSPFARAVMSSVSDGRLVVEAVSVRGDDAAAEAALVALREITPKLEHPLIETEVMRRRRATIVVDVQSHPRVDPVMREVMRWTSYVAAPLIVEGEAVGLVHADHGEDGRVVDALDRDVLWAFADAFAQIYETTSLRRALLRERDEARRFLEWMDARSGQLTDSAIELVVDDSQPVLAPDAWAVPAPTDVDDRTVFDAVLTRRELDVLRLIARGLTNRAIAADLVMAEGTVKFHVNNILRKLGAGNRAEAASRYLRMTGAGAAPAS